MSKSMKQKMIDASKGIFDGEPEVKTFPAHGQASAEEDAPASEEKAEAPKPKTSHKKPISKPIQKAQGKKAPKSLDDIRAIKKARGL